MQPLDVLLGLLPGAMIVAIVAIPLALFAVVAALVGLAAGTGASTVRDYPHAFSAHDAWVREHLRQRYLLQRGIVTDPARQAYRPYSPEWWDLLVAGKATDRAAPGGPVRIGPLPAVPAFVRPSAGRVASQGALRRRSPRASASARLRRSEPSTRLARPTRS